MKIRCTLAHRAIHPFSTLPRSSVGRALAVAGSLVLGACGGGGGGGSTAQSAAEVYDLQTAVTQAYTRTVSIAGLTATSGSRSFSMTFTLTPLADIGTINGVRVRQVEQKAVITEAGVTGTATVGSAIAFVTGPFQPLRSAGDNVYVNYTSQLSNLPTAAEPSTTRTPFLTGTIYSDAALTQAVGTANVFWFLERVDATHALLCLQTISSVTASGGSSETVSEAQDCLELDRANGSAISGARIKVGSLTFR